MKVMHQMLALIAALGIDHVPPLVVAERVQTLLHRDVQRDVLWPKSSFIHFLQALLTSAVSASSAIMMNERRSP